MQFEPIAPVPAVTLAERLRQIPLFRFVSVDELFRVSAISQQVRYETNSTVQEKGAQAEYIQILLEGSFEIQNGQHGAEHLDPPAMLGFQEVLEGTTIRNEAQASTESVALVMPAEEFRTLLSANIELAQGLFRMLLEQNGGDVSPSRIRVSRAGKAVQAVPDSTFESETAGNRLRSVRATCGTGPERARCWRPEACETPPRA